MGVRRVGLLLLLAAGTALAEPAIPAAKTSTDGYPEAARKDFLEGLLFERQGNLHMALARYGTSNSKSKQAGSLFNLARLRLKLDDVREAREKFKQYLEADPKAKDRAAITKLVKELETADPIVTLGGRPDGRSRDIEPIAMIILDGLVVGPSPATRTLKPGTYEVERVTATTYSRERFTVKEGERRYVTLEGREQNGNVLISGLARHIKWKEGDVEYANGARFALAAGHYSINGDGTDQPKTCKPIEFDVASDKHLTYVKVVLDPEDAAKGCRPVRKVSTVRVEVAP